MSQRRDLSILGNSASRSQSSREAWLLRNQFPKEIHYSEATGVVLSGVGILFLLVEEWFLLLQ